MRTDKKNPQFSSGQPDTPRLLKLPPEIICLIVHHISCRDFMVLRMVSKAFHAYFTEENICLYAHKLYFGNSSEVTRGAEKPYPGFPQRPFIGGGTSRTRLDFDNAYQRTRNWKLGQPTEVEVIDEVADGSVGSYSSIVVSPQEGLLIYQKSRGTLVIRDLNRPSVQSETVIDLQAVLGECIMLRASSVLMRDGESIRFRLNRGRLLVTGEAHEHQLNADTDTPPQHANSEDNSWSSMLWRAWSSAATPTTHTPRIRVFQQPHTLCAVLSVRPEDRGRLIQRWVEADSIMTIAALNEYYCISEFHLLEQRLEGAIFHPEQPGTAGNVLGSLAHHFTIRKKSAYPSLSTFDIAPDTKGKVFYLGFLPPPDRRPVVEVISLPTQNEDGTWTEPAVIKRVVLRTLAKHVESMGAALLRSYWIDFDDGFEVNEEILRENPGKNWKIGEDVVRLRLKGDFSIIGTTRPEEVVKLISWDITARPSPRQPSSIDAWRTGKDWKDEEFNDPQSQESPWRDESGHVDLQECYPTPTYYTSPHRPENLLTLPALPENIDADRVKLYPYPMQIWLKDETLRNKTICCLYYAEKGVNLTENLRGYIDPVASPRPLRNEDVDISHYPPVPGRNDHEFVPTGRHLHASYVVTLETGRAVKSKRAWGRTSSPGKQPVRKTKIIGRSFVQALSECHKLPYGEDDENVLDQQRIMAAKVMAKVNQRHEEQLLLPGNENGGLRGVLDWKDKRFLVYGRCGANPNRSQAESHHHNGRKSAERDSDKIVIVRYD
ncbi:hypothetical protein BDZ91DRAFT_760611 [Kalaharituber pfeilii]|nr:hypothetical protein BDZ91DRAFT_760611 [Kalaharituber pfeilii]